MVPSPGVREFILKQLVFENVSPIGQSLLIPTKESGSISEFIKAYAEVGPSYL